MINLLYPFDGCAVLELTGADIARSLRVMNDKKIPINNLRMIDELTVRFEASQKNIKQIEDIANRKGDHVRIISRTGLFWQIRSLRYRLILLCGFIMILTLSLYLPSRVLFVEVEGNEFIPDNLIINTAKDAGIEFGASRRAVRSEKMKNELLDAMPQLQWAGINTYGCRAVISVRERAVENQIENQITAGNIIASHDGIVTKLIVNSGTGTCSVGQAVQKGQLLISGYTDCGGVIIFGQAKGEVYALTCHKKTVITPSENRIRGQSKGAKTKYSMIIGKKRINLYKGSGIYDGSCVKMVSQYYLALPGDYQLPISITKEQWIEYQTRPNPVNEQQTVKQLSEFSQRLLHDESISLSIMDKCETVNTENGCIVLNGVYNCTEMVGRAQGELTGESHGKTN